MEYTPMRDGRHLLKDGGKKRYRMKAEQLFEEVRFFRNSYPGYGMETYIVNQDETSVVMRTVITNETGAVVSTGLARELKPVEGEEKNWATARRGTYIEICENRSVHRALKFFGITLPTPPEDELEDDLPRHVEERLGKVHKLPKYTPEYTERMKFWNSLPPKYYL